MIGPELFSPPMYRRFLAGDPADLRLSLSAAGVVIAGGLALPAIHLALSALGILCGWSLLPGPLAAATLSALLLAALAARWLGSRLGALAGLIYLATPQVLFQTAAGGAGMWFSVAVAAAMAAFAVANVPGRLGVVRRRWTPVAFYAAAAVAMMVAGPAGPALILAGCFGYMLAVGDPRGVRFFADPTGIAVGALLVLVWLLPWQPRQDVLALLPSLNTGGPGAPVSVAGVLGFIALGTLPWTPLIAVAVVGGLYRGHYATPVWVFFCCWTLAPLPLAALGALPGTAYLGALLPPLAVLATAGLSSCYLRCRCRWRELMFHRSQMYGG